MNEAQLWQLVKKNIDGHLVRIENTAGIGTPDVHACLDGQEVWIELKVVKGNFIYFQASQLAWFTRRVAAGGNVKVLWRRKCCEQDGINIAPAQHILSALQHIADIDRTPSICRIPIAKVSFENFCKPWRWKRITASVYRKERNTET